MSKDKKLIPKRRFKEFENSGAWEQRKAVDIAHYSKGNGYSKSDLTEIGTPIILYGRLYTKYQFCIDKIDTFTIPKERSIYSQGNEVIIPASGETTEDIARASAVGISGILLGGDLNILRPFDFINPLFLALAISNGRTQKELAKKAKGKSVVHIHNSDIKEVSIAFPKIAEQKAIESYFLNLDNLITLHQRKLEKLKADKKAYLAEMFPAESQCNPRRRFEGFTDDWEQRRLEECFTEGTDTSQNGELLSVTINSGIQRFKDLNRHDNSNVNKGNYKVVNVGDIVYNSMRMWQGASGYSPYKGIVSPAYTVLNPKIGIDSKFFSYMFKKRVMILLFQFRSQGITSDTWNLKFQPFSKIIVNVPNIQEQKKISCFLNKFDNLITLHQRRLEKLKNIKKAYLNEMFI